MKIVLVPDPISHTKEDAFCREVAKRAQAHGHTVLIQAVPEGATAAVVEKLVAEKFAADADVVLINSLQPAAFFAAKALGKKVVVRLIDSGPSSSNQSVEEFRELALKADRVLVANECLSRRVKDWGGNGAVREVPYAYDRIMVRQIALVTMRAGRPSGFSLVACAPLNEERRAGFELLLNAVARLRLSCQLFIIGEGPALQGLKAFAQKLLLSDRVSFLGEMEPHRIMEYLRMAKAYIDPCGLEGFPAWALCALAEGCPVIGAAQGALSELIRDGENGLLFAAGNAQALSENIVSLYSEQGLSLRLIAAGVKTVERHTWDATADATFAAIEDLT